MLFASGPGTANLAAVGGVGSVGVGAAVDGGAGGREILPPPPLGELKEHKISATKPNTRPGLYELRLENHPTL